MLELAVGLDSSGPFMCGTISAVLLNAMHELVRAMSVNTVENRPYKRCTLPCCLYHSACVRPNLSDEFGLGELLRNGFRISGKELDS